MRNLVTLLLLALLLTPVLPGRHTCACGMSVGCCCQLKAALRSGDRCMRLKPGTGCGFRQEGNATQRLQPNDPAWLEAAERSLALPHLSTGRILPWEEPRPLSLAAAPETPPPRLVEIVPRSV